MARLSNGSLQRRLLTRLEKAPESRALAFLEPTGEVCWRSFADVYNAAIARAVALAEYGIGPRDVCILIPENNEFSSVNLLGVLLLGAVPVLCSPPIVRGHHSNLKDILNYLVRKTKAKAVLTSDEIKPLIGDLCESHKKVRFLFGMADLNCGSDDSYQVYLPKADDVAALQLTSGTTGFPKVCVWNQQGVLAALDGMVKGMRLGTEDLFVNWTPLYHDMGLVNNFLLCLVQSMPLVMLSTFDFVKNPAIWLRVLSATHATQTWSPNFGFAITAARVSDGQIEGVRLETVRGFWNAAERIHLETIQAFHRCFASYGVSLKALKTNFGLAENIGGATFSDCDSAIVVERLSNDLLHSKGIAKIVNDSDSVENTDALPVLSVGRPYPGMQVKILSRMQRNLQDGHVGEIALETPSRMMGYLGNVRETKKALVGNLLHTGDMGYMRNGEVFWLGRLKERLNLSGKKFDPSDFENALLGVPGFREGCFAAFGIDDVVSGTQRLIIVAERRHSSSVSDKDLMREIAGAVNRQLGVKPSEVILLREGTMTKTSSGKRRHRFYRELYKKGKLQPLAQTKT